MSNEQLFRQVEILLQRKLTPEEGRFLVLASEVVNQKKKPPYKVAKASAKIA